MNHTASAGAAEDAVDGATVLKRLLKQFVLLAVQPPLRACADLIQRVLTLQPDDEADRPEQKFLTTFDYLNYWQKRIVGELLEEIGQARLSGVSAGRPHYVWGVLNGVHLAMALGMSSVSVVECGVAGGNGLVVLEAIAEKVRTHFNVNVDVYGFDTGKGNPRPTDYRDVPNLIQERDYPMDVEKLQGRLKRAKLLLGPVETTVPEFLASRPSPIAFVSFDFATYSATSKAMKLFDADESLLLPRVQCYCVGTAGLTFSDYTADRLAISEFNAAHALRKISPCYGLDVVATDSRGWAPRMFLAHMFDHSLYCANDGLIKDHNNALAS